MIVTPVFLKQEKNPTKQNNTTAFQLKKQSEQTIWFFYVKKTSDS